MEGWPEVESHHHYTIPPGVESHFTMRTLPNASCVLRPDSDGDGSLLMFSDPDGLLDLHVHPHEELEENTRLYIEAKAGPDTVQHVLELRVSGEPTDRMPPPPERSWQPARQWEMRPGLGPEEYTVLDDEEVIRRGYPPRPNPESAPAAFEAWRRVVSSPTHLIEPHCVPRPDATHRGPGLSTPKTAPNWSGFDISGPNGTYEWVEGLWTVPKVTTGEIFKTTSSSSWVGLDDGLNMQDLVQAGTAQNNYTYWTLHRGVVSISTYYAWTQFLPQQPAEAQITNFPITPGDVVLFMVSVGDRGQRPSLNGQFGVFDITNATKSTSVTVYTPRGSTSVRGSWAEWIVERGTIINNGVPDGYWDLSKYDSMEMAYPCAQRTDGRYEGYPGGQGGTSEQWTMTNGPRILSAVSAVNPNTIQFTWKAFI